MIFVGLTFRKTGGRTRLYFLSEPATKRDTSLFYTDLPPSLSQSQNNPQWCPLIEAGFQALIPSNVSKVKGVVLQGVPNIMVRMPFPPNSVSSSFTILYLQIIYRFSLNRGQGPCARQ